MKHTFLWLTLFSIAMGYLETSVVVYLRAIYYPEGFDFPLVNMSPAIALTELGRELATLIMLAGIGTVAGKNRTQRFAWFLYCFAVWDIFYYVFLKVLLDWPSSVFTWDILFLIPLPWVGPVIAPVLVSLSMILLASYLVKFSMKDPLFRLNAGEWTLLGAGSGIVIFSFILDSARFIFSYPSVPRAGEGSTAGGSEWIMEAVSQYIPADFNWWIFWSGEILILAATGLFFVRGKRVIS